MIGNVRRALVVLLLLGALAPGPASAQDARSRRVIEAVGRGSLLPAARRLSASGRGPRHKLGRSDVAARVDRLLRTAAEEAAHRPARARVLADAARRLASRHALPLDGAAVDSIQAAARRFRRLEQVLRPDDPYLARLIPREGTWPLQTVTAYARAYAATQREYNGGRPHEVLARHPEYGQRTRGRVPYWDVDPGLDDVEVVGLTEGSPFVTEEGKIRIFSHYLNAREHERLDAELGPPTGTVEAEMTSSYRTLMVFPEGRMPFMLKFSGHEMHSERKRLTAAHVLRSVERTLQLRRFGFLVPEPSGLVARGVTALYRPLPLPVEGPIGPGDRVLTWQVLMAGEFRGSEIGQRIFARFGDFRGWIDQQVVPKLAGLLYRCMFESFTHLELHSQNVDVIVAEDGTVREVRVKDLLDLMHDPVAEILSGREPLAPSVVRDDPWGDVGHADARYNVGGLYSAFFGQMGDGTRDFHGRVVDHLVARVLANPPAAGMAGTVGLGIAANSDHDLSTRMTALRSAFVEARLAETFRPDPGVRVRFERAGRDVFARDVREARRFALSPDMELGTAAGAPVALVRYEGRIERYYFLIE